MHFFIGLLERYHITRCQLGFDGCVLSSTKYTSGTSLTKPMIYAVLSRVIHQHASLGVQINTTSAPYFVRLPSIELSKAVSIVADAQSLEEVVSANLATPFETDSISPLWRLVVLPDNTAIFAYHHAIGDGQSGLAFHRSFLAALNNLPEVVLESDNIVMVPQDLALEPPTEELTDTSVSFGGMLHTFYDVLAPASWKAGASAWTGNTIVTQPSLKTNVRLWEIPSAEVSAFLRICKSHKTTLTGAFHTISVIVLSRLIATTGQSHKYKTIHTAVPLSLRRYTGTSPDAMCDQASAYSAYPPITTPTPGRSPAESFPWDAASQYINSLRKGMKASLEVIGTIKYLFSLGIDKDFFVGKLGKKRDYTLEISNVGTFSAKGRDEATQGRWNIESMYFGQCDPICGAAIKMNVVGSPSGTVNVAFTWGEGAVDNEMADAFITGFKSELLAIIA